MIELRFQCPHCGQHFAGAEDYVGCWLDCPMCHRAFPLEDPRNATTPTAPASDVPLPGPGTHAAPIAPEVQARLAADAAAAAAPGQLSKTARLTQFIGHLLHPRPVPRRRSGPS